MDDGHQTLIYIKLFFSARSEPYTAAKYYSGTERQLQAGKKNYVSVIYCSHPVCPVTKFTMTKSN